MNSSLPQVQRKNCNGTLVQCTPESINDAKIYLVDDQGKETLVSKNMIDLALRRAESVSLGHSNQ